MNSTPPLVPASARPTRLLLWPIVLVALAIRIAIVAVTLHTRTAFWFFNEASELGCLAQSLLVGHGFSSPFGGDTGPSAFMAPGYPLFVAAVFRLFGAFTKASAAVIMLFQAGFATATVLLLMRLTQRLFGSAAANLAGFIWACSPALVFFPIVFWESTLSTLLVVALVTLALNVSQAPTLARWLALGACSLFTLAVNPSVLTVIFACFLWSAWRSHSFFSPRLWTSIALCTLVFSLWPLRNYKALHAFIPLRTNMGYELWQGNRPGSDGFFDRDLHPNRNRDQFKQLGELAYMQQKADLGKAAIRADKLRFARLSLHRFVAFWAGAGPDSAPLMVLYATAGTLCGLTGLILLFRRSRSIALLLLGPILLFPLPYYLTHPDFRFRCDIDPLIIALAAFALVSCKSGAWKSAARKSAA
jgi:4-amino-4-deoxy-L-arabinose transferase-like glycosyltransferase